MAQHHSSRSKSDAPFKVSRLRTSCVERPSPTNSIILRPQNGGVRGLQRLHI
ncbi:hypothetical protein Emed_007649 [Eimeria media]